MSDSCQANELFASGNYEYDKVNFLLAPPLVKREEQNELNQINYKIKVDL